MTTPDQNTARQDLAVETSHHLIAMEQSLDRTLAHGADLIGALAQGRIASGLGVNVGADALGEITTAMAELGQTRRRMGKAHGELAAIARKFGVDETLMNGGGDKDPSIQTAEPSIRRVA